MGVYLLSSKTSYHKISQIPEVARVCVQIIVSFLYVTGASVALLKIFQNVRTTLNHYLIGFGFLEICLLYILSFESRAPGPGLDSSMYTHLDDMKVRLVLFTWIMDKSIWMFLQMLFSCSMFVVCDCRFCILNIIFCLVLLYSHCI